MAALVEEDPRCNGEVVSESCFREEVLGLTLQGTLMNHSSTVASIAKQLNESRLLSNLPDRLNPDLPFILGETNSLYNQGRPGLSNTFGATLWGIDFNLWCATNNI